MKNPLAYFHIATFLLSGKSRNLSEYWKAEVIMRDKFVLHRLIRNGMQRQRGFLMWWRLANEMFIYGNKKQRKCAIKIKNALMERYGCDIGLGRGLVKVSCCLIMQVSSFMVMLISVRMSLYGRIQPLVKRFLTVGKTILLLAIMSILVPIHVLLG